MFQVEIDDGIAILKLARPPANAITFEMAMSFEAAYDEVVATAPRALVLTGSGKFFSGGLDLREVPTYDAEQQQAFLEVVNRLIGKLYASPFPVVAAANGHAVAAGYILLLTADYRVGPEGDFAFGLTEARVGIPFPAAPMIVLKSELAPQDVRFTTLHAKNYGPEEALRRGVFDELQEAPRVLERALEIAADLASMPRESYGRIKTQVRRETIEALEELDRSHSDPMLKDWISPSAESASAKVLKGA
jgi:enoyl-CoA hydratase